MEGSLLRKGIGWYLKYEDILEEMDQDRDDPFIAGNTNPGTIIGFMLGAAYVVYPVDFIPDHIPYVGYVDDAIVLRFTTSFGTFLYDLFD